MRGWPDQNGAPTFGSSFVPSSNAVVVGNENGIVHFRIPGILTQKQNNSRTAYRAVIEVYALRNMLIHGGKAIN
jgi:hypothetical protein